MKWQHIKENLIDLLSNKESKNKLNSKNNGKNVKRLELIYFIKFLTTDKERSMSIKDQNNKN